MMSRGKMLAQMALEMDKDLDNDNDPSEHTPTSKLVQDEIINENSSLLPELNSEKPDTTEVIEQEHNYGQSISSSSSSSTSSNTSSSSKNSSSSSTHSSASDSSDEDCEDLINDPSFKPQDSSTSLLLQDSSSSETECTEAESSQHHIKTDNKEKAEKKGRKRVCDQANWEKNVSKRLRNTGQSYERNSKIKKIANPRQIKPPCNEKCRLNCRMKISANYREEIFSTYWNLGSLEKQRYFINSCIEQIQPKYRYMREASRSSLNNAFYFMIRNQKVRVCKVFFKNTLDINDRPIRTVIAKRDKFMNDVLEEDRRGKHGHHVRKDEEMRAEVKRFIANIPKVESHYRRSESTRHYIEGNKFIADLHRDYVAHCKEKNYPFCNYLFFYRIFVNEFNIFNYTPRNDQCELCVAYSNASSVEKEAMKAKYQTHSEEKELARAEKNSDKEMFANTPNIKLAVYDLEAVFQCPKAKASIFYYKSKLNVFNFSIYDLTSKTADCYVWHEGLGNRGVNELGTCVYRYLQEISIAAEEIEVIFYSDNCPGQQKNKFMFSLYLYAVSTLNIKSITHKYLIRGHTQNEGDSVHSTIEGYLKRQLKSSPLYTPDSFITAIRAARKRDPPYRAIEMSFEDFFNLKDLSSQLRFNLSKDMSNNIVKVSDIKVIKVQKCSPNSIFYKTSYRDEEYKEAVVIRESKRGSSNPVSVQLKKAFSSKPGISESKKRDLLDLVKGNFIPKYYANFFESL